MIRHQRKYFGLFLILFTINFYGISLYPKQKLFSLKKENKIIASNYFSYNQNSGKYFCTNFKKDTSLSSKIIIHLKKAKEESGFFDTLCFINPNGTTKLKSYIKYIDGNIFVLDSIDMRVKPLFIFTKSKSVSEISDDRHFPRNGEWGNKLLSKIVYYSKILKDSILIYEFDTSPQISHTDFISKVYVTKNLGILSFDYYDGNNVVSYNSLLLNEKSKNELNR